MDELEYQPEGVFAASNSVQDLIALARTHDEIADRKMKAVLLSAAQLMLAQIAIEPRIPFNTPTTQQ